MLCYNLCIIFNASYTLGCVYSRSVLISFSIFFFDLGILNILFNSAETIKYLSSRKFKFFIPLCTRANHLQMHKILISSSISLHILTYEVIGTLVVLSGMATTTIV